MGLRKAAESLVQALGLALIFGLFTAITLNAYILINYFSLTSNRLLALVLLAAPVGSIVFYFVFRWLRPKLAGLAPLVLLFLVCLSLLLSIFLFYTTSDGWSDEHRYPSVLLPNHTLKIQAIDSQENLTIQWLNTSAQEISYDSAHLKGWQRKGNNLVLVDPKDNSIEWQGKIGNQLSIVFQRPQQETTVLIGINGAEDRLTLQNTGPDEITILR